MNRLLSGSLVLVLTILSGIMDARGFVYASRAWPQGRLDVRLAAASVLAFLAGLCLYIAAVRFMKGIGVNAVTLQSAIWLVVTAIGLAIMDGTILQWTRAQKVVAIIIACGLTWLIATARAEAH
jgi:hypothetical protein